jgi:tetratricopeptide (TPR) repeat protein
MKTKQMHGLMLALLFALVCTMSWSQGATNKVQGKVTKGGQPIANARITLTNVDTGKTFPMKADKDGSFSAIGIPLGNYDQEISDASGEKLFKRKVSVAGQNGQPDDLSVDVSAGTVSAAERSKLEAERNKTIGLNTLISQYNAAQQAKNWQQAADTLKQMIAAAPNRWEYQEALGDMQMNLTQYEEAAATYEKTIPVAQDSAKTDPKADPAKIKAAVGKMLTNEGVAYTKLKQTDKAVQAYTKAAEMDPNPATAYFNLCATQYNSGNTQGALAACDKAIAADPNRADAYFIKGSLMMAESKQGKDGKLEAPEGTSDALNKYLQLAPDGPHANDVKQMLAFIGAKVETTYHEKKKK